MKSFITSGSGQSLIFFNFKFVLSVVLCKIIFVQQFDVYIEVCYFYSFLRVVFDYCYNFYIISFLLYIVTYHKIFSRVITCLLLA